MGVTTIGVDLTYPIAVAFLYALFLVYVANANMPRAGRIILGIFTMLAALLISGYSLNPMAYLFSDDSTGTIYTAISEINETDYVTSSMSFLIFVTTLVFTIIDVVMIIVDKKGGV